MANASHTSQQVQKLSCDIALLPIGATEQHGPHLPLATDSLIAEGIAQRVADRLHAYCLPPLPFSISHMHRSFTGTVWLKNSTLMLVIRDIALSLSQKKFKHLVLINGHGGNHILRPIVQDLNLEMPHFRTLQYFDFFKFLPPALFKAFPGIAHADDYETSIMLYLHPTLVRTHLIPKTIGRVEADEIIHSPIYKLSKRPYSGKPSLASQSKGKKAVDSITENLAKHISQSLSRHR